MPKPRVGCLVDVTRCVGCRSCQVACKSRHDLAAEKTKFFARPGGYQNPRGVSPQTRTFIAFRELTTGPVADARTDPLSDPPRWFFLKHQCMHCQELRCATGCAPELFSHSHEGVVLAMEDQCIGCGACLNDCPFQAVAVEYFGLTTPYLRKCTFCFDTALAGSGVSSSLGDAPAPDEDKQAMETPACATACPSGALKFGLRDHLLAEAHGRIRRSPDRYYENVYGEKECGGMGWLYLLPVAPDQLGLPTHFAPMQEVMSGFDTPE